MSEQKTGEKTENIVIRTVRHPDEQAYRELKKQNKRLSFICYALMVVLMAAAGAFFGYVYETRKRAQTVDDRIQEKINTTMSIMTNDWFFGKDIEDAKERFLNQALTGMTTNEEDPHTAYMSKQQVEDFVTSINHSYVGIGVQFIAGDNLNMIERVFKNSPAQKAGVQPGDQIRSVDGVLVEGMSSDNIADLVRGEEGVPVHMEFLRDGEIVSMDIVRAALAYTAWGEILPDGTAILEILQFGDTTGEEIKGYLEDFKEAGAERLIIDLRDDGGGYLTSLQEVGGLFLGRGVPVLREEYANGSVNELKTTANAIWGDGEIVLLVNGNTASAAEAFTLAMKEQRADVTVIGTQTYGKGTVQVTRGFTDGSALKYTTSKWLSPGGVWINGTGITPDETVELHPILTEINIMTFPEEPISVDSVSENVRGIQLALDYLGYEVDRTDGYYSEATRDAVNKYRAEHDLPENGLIDEEVMSSAASAVILNWNTSHDHDTQLQRAQEVLNG